MVILSFSLVWLDLIWFRSYPCLDETTGKIPAGKEN